MNEKLKALTDDDIQDICHGFEDVERIEVVDAGKWQSDSKYDYKYVVFKFEDTLFGMPFYRSGSWFTDYEYIYPERSEIREVEVVTKVVTTYEPKK